jgi:hypothetical protein
MFSRNKQPPIKSLIAEGSRIEGNVLFTDGLRIDGEVVGDVRVGQGTPSLLVISATAKVEGAVHADHVIVNGQIHGPVHARDHAGTAAQSAHCRGCLLQNPGNAPGRHHLRKDGPADAVVEEKPTLKLAANNP